MVTLLALGFPGFRLHKPSPPMSSSRAPSAASTVATKRSRTEEGDPADPPHITRDEFHGFLATFRTDITADITNALADSTSARIEQIMNKIDESFTRRLNAQELIVSDLASRTAVLENEKADINAKLDRLQAMLAVAEVAPRATEVDGTFDRAPDPTVIRLSAKELISPDAAREALRPWFDEAEIGADLWDVFPTGGGGISRHLVVSLKGQANLAARRVRKLLDLRRLPAGGWKPNPQARTPAGRMVEIFASPDKNMKQIRTELAAKRLHRALSVLTVGKDIHHNKRSGIISIDWKPVAKVEAKPNDDFSITWNAPILTDLGINKQLVLDKFNADGPTSTGIEWSE